MIALNAAPIVAARMNGKKPDGMIRVSLVGALENGLHTVHAKPHVPHDWRWVHSLEICVFIGAELDWLAAVKAIALCRPKYLNLWNIAEKWGAHVYLVPSKEDISRPPREWQYELDYLPWLDFQNDDFRAGRTYTRNERGFPQCN